MTTRRSFLLSGAALCGLVLVPSLSRANEVFAITHSDDEWRKLLTPDQFAILRKSATAGLTAPLDPYRPVFRRFLPGTALCSPVHQLSNCSGIATLSSKMLAVGRRAVLVVPRSTWKAPRRWHHAHPKNRVSGDKQKWPMPIETAGKALATGQAGEPTWWG
jgi:hypothetical protein